jgi:hypothetical protein
MIIQALKIGGINLGDTCTAYQKEYEDEKISQAALNYTGKLTRFSNLRNSNLGMKISAV